ncbi:ABC transporter ATP-binding protein/permease [Flavobacteriales bacterium]|nr:ABC transporter ATP-binding protein/permease [Flavobacteriales bacterium]
MKNLIRIAKITLQFKRTLFLNLGFNILGMVFSIFSFAMIIPLLRIIFNSSNTVFEKTISSYSGDFNWSKDGVLNFINYYLAKYAISEGRYSALILICIFLVIMVFLKNMFTFLSTFFLSDLVQSSVKKLREKMYQKILVLPMSFFSDERKGNLLSTFSADLKETELAIKATTNAIFKDPFYVIGYFATLFIISYKLTFFIVLFLPIAGLIISKVSNGLKKRSKKGQENLGDILSLTEETLFGLRIIKSFNAQSFMNNRFEKKSNSLYTLMLGINRRIYLASPISEFLGVLATSSVLLYGGNLVLNEFIQPDVFIGYLILFSQLISPFKSISKAIYDSSLGIAALERIEKITLEDKLIINNPENPEPVNFNKEISFKNVSFKYNKEQVLENISFKIKKGETVAIVGHSGSGKSTIADLLIRFYDAVSGEIKIDNLNIKEINLNQLRSLMGVVTQDSILFNDTVINNIAFGVEIENSQVLESAKMANANEFIQNLDKKYETFIGDAGNKLSGGEKQRLSIARAIYKNPEILILDEATSSLDTKSEKAVQEALNRLMKNRTSMVIAHRLSTIQNADKIIVLDSGKIVEMGSHNELLSKNSFYKKFIDMQSFE